VSSKPGAGQGIAIYFCVKNKRLKGFHIQYQSVRDYAKAEEKLEFVRFKQLAERAFEQILPDKNGRWLDQIDNDFESLIPIATKETKATKATGQERAIFKLFSRGVATMRDEWVYDVGDEPLRRKVEYFADVYEQSRADPHFPAKDSIKWDRELEKYAARGVQKSFNATSVVNANYRPFVCYKLYFDDHFNGMTYQLHSIFGAGAERVPSITIMGDSTGKPYFCLGIDRVPDLNFVSPASGGRKYFRSNVGAQMALESTT
jgi:predicted helicase